MDCPLLTGDRGSSGPLVLGKQTGRRSARGRFILEVGTGQMSREVTPRAPAPVDRSSAGLAGAIFEAARVRRASCPARFAGVLDLSPREDDRKVSGRRSARVCPGVGQPRL